MAKIKSLVWDNHFWLARLIAIVLIGVFLSGWQNTNILADIHQDDMRAVWITTVYNSDYPSIKGDATAQKQEFIEKLDALKEIGINTVVVQVRPKADALYRSSINPWSDVLTGEQGVDPGYDPLQFMIEQAHSRGMSIHAWMNPYRVTTSGTDVSVLAATHPARIHPDWLTTYENALYYNPALPEVKGHIRDSVQELVFNYDIDGVHFDDYFYPSNYPLPEGETRDGVVAQERRGHVNEMISMVNTAIKASGKNVLFGISPMGIWKNSSSDPSGSQTNGNEGYYAVYGDARAWIQNGWVDYIVPQIYWETGHKLADYGTLLEWWSKEVEGTNVKLYIGQGTYRDVVAQQIGTQLQMNAVNPNVKGSFFFSLKDILNDRMGCRQAISAFYQSLDSTQEPIPSQPEQPEIPFLPQEPETPQEPEIPEQPILPQEPENSQEQEQPVIQQRKVQAIFARSKVLVDGTGIEFEAYNIEGNHYFKLRDLAMALNGTEKQFEVLWNEEARTVNMKSTTPYTIMGGELSTGDGKNKIATVSSDQLLQDGNKVTAMAYNIEGNNYYKLRDLGKAIDFGVTWDEETGTVSIVTLTGYTEESAF